MLLLEVLVKTWQGLIEPAGTLVGQGLGQFCLIFYRVLFCFLKHLTAPKGLAVTALLSRAVGNSPSLRAAGRLAVRARGGEPRRAARHEPQGRAGQALAAAAAVAVLPLPAARRLHHHVPLLLPGNRAGEGWSQTRDDGASH